MAPRPGRRARTVPRLGRRARTVPRLGRRARTVPRLGVGERVWLLGWVAGWMSAARSWPTLPNCGSVAITRALDTQPAPTNAPCGQHVRRARPRETSAGNAPGN